MMGSNLAYYSFSIEGKVVYYGEFNYTSLQMQF